MTDSTVQPLALITGAAHRLGRAIALELASQGFAIGLHYNASRSAAEETAQAIQAMGVPVTLLKADLIEPDEIEAMVHQVAGLPNPLRLLVNSAAVMPRADLRTIQAEEWDATLAINLRAPLLCAQAAARVMAEEGGLIVNISDAGAGRAWTGFPAYIVSKNALESLTRLLARALAPGVRVNAVAPGLILPSEVVSSQDWERLVARLPLQRPGDPAEVAQAITFLWRNPYVTGQVIAIDGGYQLI